MRKSTRNISPVYTVLVEALNAYYDRIKLPRAKKDKARAEDLGISSAILSGIKNGRYPISGRMARRIATQLFPNEKDWRALEARLQQPVVTAPDGTPYPPEVAFVRQSGTAGAILFIEHSGKFPFALRPEHDGTPMTLAFQEAMAAGMIIAIFLPYRIRANDQKSSMGDGFAETYAWQTFCQLNRLSPGSVGLYCLEENPYPTPDFGIRLTRMIPNRDPEVAWLLPMGGDRYQFIEAKGPKPWPEDAIDIIFWHRNRGEPLPTQDDLERHWKGWLHIRELPTDRPCPIRRVG